MFESTFAWSIKVFWVGYIVHLFQIAILNIAAIHLEKYPSNEWHFVKHDLYFIVFNLSIGASNFLLHLPYKNIHLPQCQPLPVSLAQR